MDKEDDFYRLVEMVRQIAEGVVRQGHQLEEIKHRVAQLEHERVTNAVGILHSQRDIIE